MDRLFNLCAGKFSNPDVITDYLRNAIGNGSTQRHEGSKRIVLFTALLCLH